MDTNKRVARIVGVLFIIGTGAGILSGVFTGSFLDHPNYLVEISANKNQLMIGALLVLTMGFSLAMVPVMLFPIFKKYNETLALGAVVFRGVLEAVGYMVFVISWFLLLLLSQAYVQAGSPDNSYFQTLGTVFLELGDWISHLISIVFSLGALMIYYLFYKTKLIPSWLSVWGLVGGLLYLAVPLLAMFGIELEILYIPLAVQEMVFAVWLIVKGFNSSVIASQAAEQVLKR